MKRVTPGDRPAVILGSGFSRAISDSMPTLTQLRDLVLQDLSVTVREPVTARHLEKFGGSLEQWMSFLAVDQPWLTEAENLANRSLFEHVRESLARCITSAEGRALATPPPDWLIRLVWTWCDEEVPVITFNYDTLIERAIAHMSRVRTFADVYAAPLMERTAAGDGAVFGADEPLGPVLSLYKLHGSTNWAFGGLAAPPNDRIVLTDPFLRWTEQGTRPSSEAARYRSRFADLTALIVPPTLSKGPYFSNLGLRAQWAGAAHALARAMRLTVFGYSFPSGDIVARQWVETSFMGHQMDIVDADESRPEQIRSSLAGARSGEDSVGPNAVQEYVDQMCGPLIRWDLRERDSTGKLVVNLSVNGEDALASMSEEKRPWGQDYWAAQRWVHERIEAAARARGIEKVLDRAIPVRGMSGNYDSRFVVLPRGSRLSLH